MHNKKIKPYLCFRNLKTNKIMKYIRVISTCVLLVYISHLSDAVYVKWFTPDLEKMQGLSKTCYQVFLSLSRGIMGFALGVNIIRISNFIWNKKD